MSERRSWELRHASAGAAKVGGVGVPFDQWERIREVDGDFMERFRPGAFTRSLREDPRPKLLFQHGGDPTVGAKVLGRFDTLIETSEGLEFEGSMVDTGYAADIAEGVRLGEYGMSVAFKILRDKVVRNPSRSSYNPDGLPERSVTDAQLFEISIVTWPAYKGTKVALRGLVPSWYLGSLKPESNWRLPAVTRPKRDYLSRRPSWELSKKPRWKL
jgi:HK97 family phage prohead protease